MFEGQNSKPYDLESARLNCLEVRILLWVLYFGFV
jgi:hypothetical protein